MNGSIQAEQLEKMLLEIQQPSLSDQRLSSWLARFGDFAALDESHDSGYWLLRFKDKLAQTHLSKEEQELLVGWIRAAIRDSLRD
jgi:hypothetical protein